MMGPTLPYVAISRQNCPPLHAVSCLQPISDFFQTKCRMVLVQDDMICVSVRGSVSLTEAGNRGLALNRAILSQTGGFWLVTAHLCFKPRDYSLSTRGAMTSAPFYAIWN